ncbi:lipoprotein N-acyltransferase Lnb domain-containing protein [Flavobacterium sp. GNP002]
MNIASFKKIVLFILLLSTTSYSFGQSIELSKNTQVSVITCGTGNESYSLFGHTAIRVRDTINGIDVVYNYGAFDFNTPNFVMKFIKGDLQYFAVAHSYPDFITQYQYEKRSVYEQELNMPFPLKQKLFDNLNTSLASGESHYTYKFIDKNCTSMVVDIINKTLDTTAIVKNTDTDITYRTILYPYFDNHFYEKLGTSIIFGKKVDGLGTQLFLPFELQKSLKNISFQNQPLAQKNKTLLEFENEAPGSWWNNIYTYILFLGFIVLINKKSIDLFYLILIAIIGLFFTFVGFYSSHLELGYNYNILIFNPTLLGLLYFYWTKNKKGIYNLALFNILSLGIYFFVVINKVHFLLVLPLIITNGIVLVRLAIQNKKRIPIII